VSWFRGSKLDRRSGWPQHLAPDEQPSVEAGPFASPVLTGCCLVATAATWRSVGGFDERMFLMFEDSDWSLRAAARGVGLLVVPASRIHHKVSSSFTGTAGTLGTYYFTRNGTVFAARHLGPTAAVRFAVRQVVRPSMRQLITRGRRSAALMSYLGLLAAIVGKRGSAGPLTTDLARRATGARSRKVRVAP
jgi:GT2 family glycosyltransferase